MSHCVHNDVNKVIMLLCWQTNHRWRSLLLNRVLDTLDHSVLTPLWFIRTSSITSATPTVHLQVCVCVLTWLRIYFRPPFLGNTEWGGGGTFYYLHTSSTNDKNGWNSPLNYSLAPFRPETIHPPPPLIRSRVVGATALFYQTSWQFSAKPHVFMSVVLNI